MSTTTAFKIGLLAIATMAAALAVVFALGLRRPPTDTYRTYFDESIQGLEVGAPVKYRGVQIGRVAGLAIAPDREHVAVELDVDRATARDLALDEQSARLRARLAIQGVTGLKFIDIDVVDPTTPLPRLSFPPGPRYIPSRLSLLGDLGDDLASMSHRLPQLVDRSIATLDKLERLLDGFHTQALPQRTAAVLDGASQAVADVRHLVAGVDRARLPDKARATVARLDAAIARLDGLLARADGIDGLLASARRATDSFGALGENTRDSSAELDRTLRDLGEAARSFRELVEEIDRDPDMLVKGRGRSRRP